ncbi:MAG: FixH family protein [Bacteroidota bacterium]
MVRVPVYSLLAAIVLVGCGSGSAVSDDGGTFLNCASDTRAVPYAPGMLATSTQTSPVFTIKLVNSDPGPPVKGDNTWTLEVDETATGTPLDGLDVTVTPWMPDHMHGTTKVVEVTPAAAAGQYALAPVYLRMSGFWQVKVTVISTKLGGGTTELSVIPICIP